MSPVCHTGTQVITCVYMQMATLQQIFAGVSGAQAHQGFWTYQSASAAYTVTDVDDKLVANQKVYYISPGASTQVNPCQSHMSFFANDDIDQHNTRSHMTLVGNTLTQTCYNKGCAYTKCKYISASC